MPRWLAGRTREIAGGVVGGEGILAGARTRTSGECGHRSVAPPVHRYVASLGLRIRTATNRTPSPRAARHRSGRPPHAAARTPTYAALRSFRGADDGGVQRAGRWWASARACRYSIPSRRQTRRSAGPDWRTGSAAGCAAGVSRWPCRTAPTAVRQVRAAPRPAACFFQHHGGNLAVAAPGRNRPAAGTGRYSAPHRNRTKPHRPGPLSAGSGCTTGRVLACPRSASSRLRSSTRMVAGRVRSGMGGSSRSIEGGLPHAVLNFDARKEAISFIFNRISSGPARPPRCGPPAGWRAGRSAMTLRGPRVTRCVGPNIFSSTSTTTTLGPSAAKPSSQRVPDVLRGHPAGRHAERFGQLDEVRAAPARCAWPCRRRPPCIRAGCRSRRRRQSAR